MQILNKRERIKIYKTLSFEQKILIDWILYNIDTSYQVLEDFKDYVEKYQQKNFRIEAAKEFMLHAGKILVEKTA